MKLRTEQLKDMLSKAVKGASNNRLIPITSLLSIRIREGRVILETTDATNYLYVYGTTELADELTAVVNVDLFAKLISKTTTEFIELDVMSSNPILSVRGNGSYTIEMPLDESGKLIEYPDPIHELNTVEPDFSDSIKRTMVSTILDSVKPSLATTYENPCYTGYYIGKEVLATDSYKIAGLNNLFMNKESLISPEVMDLLGLMTAENIKVSSYSDKFIYATDDVVIYGPEMEGKEDFAVDAISGLLETDFEYTCRLSKSDFLSVLDRLSLFISPYDKNAITLTFIATGVQISSKASSGVEVINYIDQNEHQMFTCDIDIEMLIQEIKAIPSDIITLQYGEDNAIKLVDNSLTIVIALLED